MTEGSQPVPQARLRALHAAPPRANGRFVLYWMTATRRARWNFALERAVGLARELQKPLVVLEALRVDYPFASARLHRFVLDGMRANERAFAGKDVFYYPYVEPAVGAGKGLLKALAQDACAVVTDDYPCFFLPAMLARARTDVRVHFEAVDSNGLLPMRTAERAFARAHDFRRFLQRVLAPHLAQPPRQNALARVHLPRLPGLPGDTSRRWPRADARLLGGTPATLAALPIDHAVAPVDLEGGAEAGARVLRRFVGERLEKYGESRNDPDSEATSGLSPYLHFGHVSAHQVLESVAAHEGRSRAEIGGSATGRRAGWWNMRAPAEAFLDQLVTWRELGFNACVQVPGYDRYESLPAWARSTLAKHADDERPEAYGRARFERAETHDELWNAAQNQLRRQGVIHNYLRMLWGKKILHWSKTPRAALATMIELNDKYALDGRDPNSYSGILWTLGKYDRPWGPERPIFGRVRYMTSANTRRKLRVDDYIRRWSSQA
ncbi:MAG: deoxyribodipyrimidine photolyase [Planctomycetes bacterium]|nr:deoxyribodipyrimidine photolyase [Planctomycetota bacterium]